MRRLRFEWEPRPSPGAVWSKRPRIEYLSSARHTAPFRTVRPANPANQRQCGVRQKSGPPLSSSQNHQVNHRGTQAQRKGKHARAETRRRGVETEQESGKPEIFFPLRAPASPRGPPSVPRCLGGLKKRCFASHGLDASALRPAATRRFVRQRRSSIPRGRNRKPCLGSAPGLAPACRRRQFPSAQSFRAPAAGHSARRIGYSNSARNSYWR